MDEKEKVRLVFAKNKQAYISSSTHRKKSDLKLIEAWLQPTTTMRLLDIATGGGHVAKHLSSSVAKVYATDLTKEMLENTKKHLQSFKNIEYLIADAEQLPFLDHSFELITCRIAAHHFPHPELFIQEVKRVLKPKGKFLLIDNIAPTSQIHRHFLHQLEKMRDESHVNYLTMSEWKSLFQRNGLSILKDKFQKKTLYVKEWSNRTLDTIEEKQQVASFLLRANKEITTYFQIKTKNKKPECFSIDEWFVLLEHV